jgi:uncharacterized protein YggU (UPF0235/DUF167 family)
LVAFVASGLRLGRRYVTVRAGQASRAKQIRIDGDPDDLAQRIAGWIAGVADPA